MNTGLATEDIKNIQAVFASFPEVEEAILYGSRAKGTYREGSDIDICLAGGRLNLSVINTITQRMDELNLPYLFDMAILHRITNTSLRDHISRVGITLYRKEALPIS